jgi:hypothetical protein
LEGFRLTVVLKLTRLGTPYDGPLALVIHNGGQVVYAGQAEVCAGQLEADLELQPLTFGDIALEMTTPAGDMAAAVCRQISWEEWDKITLNPLQPAAEAAAVPFRGAEGEVRGLHYAHKREPDGPFVLESIVGTEGHILARHNAEFVHLLVFDPLSTGHRKIEFQSVKAGEVLSFEVGSPYAIFTLGAFMGRALPYEAWGSVLRPVDLRASLSTPAQALPGATISASVQTDRPADCLLVVHDARLEREDPLIRLARCIFEHIFSSTWRLEARGVGQVAWLLQGGLQTLHWQFDLQGTGRPMRTALRDMYQAPLKRAGPRPFLLTPGESIPELAHFELFPVEGTVTRRVRLGDRPGTWHCRAYFFHGHDVVAAQSDIQVT